MPVIGWDVIGWDVGGAHLKAAWLDGAGVLREVVQVPCPLWLGLDRLDGALAEVLARFPRGAVWAATMTGELADIFDSRAAGVAAITDILDRHRGGPLWIYAGPDGFLTSEQAPGRVDRVASANWYATAELAAERLGQGLLVDVGSTTTDLIPFRDRRPQPAGFTDAERLAADELVYTGVVRTAVMAVANRVPFRGRWQGVMAELFATMADVHRLTGDLPADADQHPAADGRDKSEAASAARLARMVGADLDGAGLPALRALAAWLAEAQLRALHDAATRVLSSTGPKGPVVGAGIGRFVAARLAARLGRPYRDLAEVFEAGPAAGKAADCAPAAALAFLIKGKMGKP